MFPSSFEYTRANSVAEAVALLGKNPNAKLIAGGHSLLPALKFRLSQPSLLIDISRIAALRGIKVSGGNVVIGSMTTHAEIAASKEVQNHCPALSDAASIIGDMQVRNRGTIGGSLSHADPAADLPAVMIALGASFKVAGPKGERTIAADSFFTDLFATALAADEVLVEISVPAAKKSAYVKFAHPASGYAVVGVAAAVGANGQTTIGVTGACAKATKLAAGGALKAADCLSDNFASGEYRAHLAGVLAKRATAKANSR